MKNNKESLNWLLTHTENCSIRYIEAEQFILDLLLIPFYKRIFIYKKILKFLKSREKYKF